MKFTIKCESFLRLVQQVSGVAEKKQNLPILSNVLICVENAQISLTASDLEIELTAKDTLQGDCITGEITAPGRKILDICRNLPENDDIHCEVRSDRLILQSGRSKFELATLPAADFPAIQRGSAKISARFPQNILRQLIMSTRFAMANNDSRYYLNGMLFETDQGKLKLIATDGHRLAVNESTEAFFPLSPAMHVIVPRKAIMELLPLLNDSPDWVDIQVDDNILKVTSARHEFITKLIEGRFPDYKRVIPPPATMVLGLDREELKQGLLRAATLSNEKNRGVRLQLGTDLLRIVANNPEQEQSEAALPLPYQGAPLEIGFNATYLVDVLNALPAGAVSVKLIDPSCSAVITGQETPGVAHFHVVMPLRL